MVFVSGTETNPAKPSQVVAGSEYIGLPAFSGIPLPWAAMPPFFFWGGRKAGGVTPPEGHNRCLSLYLFLSFMTFFPPSREQLGEFRLRLRVAHAVHGEDAPRERRAICRRRVRDCPHKPVPDPVVPDEYRCCA